MARSSQRSSNAPAKKEASGEFVLKSNDGHSRDRFRLMVAAADPTEAGSVSAVASRSAALRDGVWIAPTWDDARARLYQALDDACVLVWPADPDTAVALLREAVAHGWKVPIVVIAPRDDLASERNAMSLGASEWLVRPVLTPDELERVVRHVVGRAALAAGLRERERRFRAVFDAGGEARLLIDDEGRCVDANAVARHAFGLPPGDLAAAQLASIVGLTARDRLAPLWSSREPSAEHEATLRMQSHGGVPVIWHARVVPCVLPDCHLVVLRDVTEREEQNQRLALTERMSSLGTLASGMAHAINNPLQVLYASIDLLQQHIDRARGPSPEEPLQSLASASTELASAREAAERVQRVVRDLAVFTRADRGEMSRVNLSVPLETAIRLTATTIRHRATLVKEVRPVAAVMGNEAQLTQVFVHLLLNAAQAIPEGGAAQHQVRVSMARALDGRAQVTVGDTGHGMSPEVLSRVFDPFFTTRPVGEGAGLGLSVCHGTVASMGGEIQVESELGRGSTFRVLLPILEGPARPSTMTPIPAFESMPRCHVLVIDDDPMVCRSLSRLLQGHHDVEALTSCGEALERIRGGERFDAILCDVMMPEMSGVDFYQQLVAHAPDQSPRVVFVTGGVFSQETRAFLDEGQHRVVEKPVTQGALFRALMRVIPSEHGD